MSRLVVAISREFGSGGRLLGERLAQELGLRFYDRALLTLAARDSGFAPEAFEEAEAEAANRFLFNLSMGGGAIRDGLFWAAPPVGDQIFIAQSKTIERLAGEGGCVLVGRCAAHLLRRDPHCLKVFVHGEKEDRLRRIVSQYGVPEAGAEDLLNRMDRGRANYYEHYTTSKWGDVHDFDLAVNTTSLGLELAVRLVRMTAEARLHGMEG